MESRVREVICAPTPPSEILELLLGSPVGSLWLPQPASLPPPQKQIHSLTRREPRPGPKEGPRELHPGPAGPWECGCSVYRLLTAARSLPRGGPQQTPLCRGSPLSSLGPQMSPPSPHPSRGGPSPTSLQHMIHKRAHFDLPTTSELLRRR